MTFFRRRAAPAAAGMSPYLLAIVATFTAQQLLMPVLPPLVRQLGLTEVQLGMVLSTTAVVVVLAAPVCGWLCPRVGHRWVLVAGLACACAGLAGLALSSQAVLAGALGHGWIFGLALVSRGALFGVGLAAAQVASIAYVAGATARSTARTAGISRLGAAQGLSSVLGPVLGLALSFAEALAPLYAAPVILAAACTAVAAARPPQAVQPQPVRDHAVYGRVRAWDAGVWPYLAIGFVLNLALVTVILIGFLLQDRLALTPSDTVRAGSALACGSAPCRSWPRG